MQVISAGMAFGGCIYPFVFLSFTVIPTALAYAVAMEFVQ
jgi:hypothetical protein